MSLEILRLKKVSKISVIVVRVLQLVLVINLIAAVYGIVAHKQNAAFENANIEMLPGYASVVMQVLLVLVLFPIAELLKSLYNGYTPFDMDNVKRLKYISYMLGLTGFLQFAMDVAYPLFSYIDTTGGEQVKASFFRLSISTPLILVVAAIVFCVALVFQYGTGLQRQSDETL